VEFHGQVDSLKVQSANTAKHHWII